MPDDDHHDDGEAGSKLDPAIRRLIRALADMQADADHKAAMEEARMYKEIDRFKCVGTSGRQYTVVEQRRIITTHETTGAHEIEGSSRLLTTDGQPVNALDDGTFELPLKDEILRKV